MTTGRSGHAAGTPPRFGCGQRALVSAADFVIAYRRQGLWQQITRFVLAAFFCPTARCGVAGAAARPDLEDPRIGDQGIRIGGECPQALGSRRDLVGGG